MIKTDTNYIPSTNDYKLNNATCSVKFSKRQLKLWKLSLNRLGIPGVFQEVVEAIYLIADWKTCEWLEINMHQLAWGISSNNTDRKRLHNRLKKNLPRFFHWQEAMGIEIISRNVETYQSRSKNGIQVLTKVSYKFLIDSEISQLFNIPNACSEKKIKEYVEKIFVNYSLIPEDVKIKPKKKVKNLAKNVVINLEQLKLKTGDMGLVLEYLYDANYMLIQELIDAGQKSPNDKLENSG